MGVDVSPNFSGPVCSAFIVLLPPSRSRALSVAMSIALSATTVFATVVAMGTSGMGMVVCSSGGLIIMCVLYVVFSTC